MAKIADNTKHALVPEHIKLSDKDKDELFIKYNITVQDLPKISSADPALQNMDVKYGDVIMIKRSSATAGDTVFYRGVTNA